MFKVQLLFVLLVGQRNVWNGRFGRAMGVMEFMEKLVLAFWQIQDTVRIAIETSFYF